MLAFGCGLPQRKGTTALLQTHYSIHPYIYRKSIGCTDPIEYHGSL